MNNIEKFGLLLVLLIPLAKEINGWFVLGLLVAGTFFFVFGAQVKKE